ncbi:hypothetical protein SAMD00019534_090720 [Acytostelium subglobosum LB1]|uniref:hypothetical protein n=1 Tax=Acytostelium subglobosum LB1 TaxID=1410327 RepID=UPI00064515D9|nr:hypothetical protein SAMD00019534_090720 [Acytostelium subglobosum LB1]GAM25897.1 hypothetical protein SAMD00019534_090720 [Acytostelium subglobosum LB1]|eukprot:XP_012750940.1 hypothetical protein SAMD00019534_090720 [Acytostelium subglobosum LB1]
MGSYFSKKKSLEREFADIEDKILKYEDAVSNARLTQRTVFSRIILYGLLLELLLFLWTYYRTRSSSSAEHFNDNILYYSLLVIFPVTMYCFTKIFNYIYVYKIHHNESKLDVLKTQLQQKIDARKKETDYDNTQKIIDNPDGRTKVTTPPSKQPLTRVSPVKSTTSSSRVTNSIQSQLQEQSSLRHRPMPQQQQQQQYQQSPSSSIGSALIDSPTSSPAGRSVNTTPNIHSQLQQQQQQPLPPPKRPHVLQPVPIRPLPKGVIPINNNNNNASSPQQRQSQPPKQQSWLDKVVDYIISDGPKYGSPLICHNCHNHNGYVPTHELESIQFRCRFCHTFNQRGDDEVNADDHVDNNSSSSSNMSAEVDDIPTGDVVKEDKEDLDEPRHDAEEQQRSENTKSTNDTGNAKKQDVANRCDDD